MQIRAFMFPPMIWTLYLGMGRTREDYSLWKLGMSASSLTLMELLPYMIVVLWLSLNYSQLHFSIFRDLKHQVWKAFIELHGWYWRKLFYMPTKMTNHSRIYDVLDPFAILISMYLFSYDVYDTLSCRRCWYCIVENDNTDV